MAALVKICGLTNTADAQVALDAGADFLGFIFHPKSPRYVSPETVAGIIPALSLPEHVQTVGVFVNSQPEAIASVLAQTGLMLAQLHGDEPIEYLAALAGHGFKAIRPVDVEAAMQAMPYTAYPRPSAPQLFIDAYHPNAYGGTGHQADWTMAAHVSQLTERLMLAGGLTPANVMQAVEMVKPWAVDVSSGVESSPGQKDHDKVRAFVESAKRAH